MDRGKRLVRTIKACLMNWDIYGSMVNGPHGAKNIIPIGDGFVSPNGFYEALMEIDENKRSSLIDSYSLEKSQSSIAKDRGVTQGMIWWEIKTGLEQIKKIFS